jgi:type IV secretory pathway VirB10-like protein
MKSPIPSPNSQYFSDTFRSSFNSPSKYALVSKASFTNGGHLTSQPSQPKPESLFPLLAERIYKKKPLHDISYSEECTDSPPIKRQKQEEEPSEDSQEENYEEDFQEEYVPTPKINQAPKTKITSNNTTKKSQEKAKELTEDKDKSSSQESSQHEKNPYYDTDDDHFYSLLDESDEESDSKRSSQVSVL